jgi:hypothetical protein
MEPPMSNLVVGPCDASNLFSLLDPDGLSEAEFEFATVKALACLFPTHKCFVFSGSFFYEGRYFKPDLALVARDYSHWFVIEVELLSHSLREHVLPQVRGFVHGVPQADCATILSREMQIRHQEALTFLQFVPRSTAVILNKESEQWNYALEALNVQTMILRLFQTGSGTDAYELIGTLYSIDVSLGFGRYFAVDRSVRFPKSTAIQEGPIQIVDTEGASSIWRAIPNASSVWLMKDAGVPSYDDGAFIQLIKARDGRFRFRNLRAFESRP